MIQSPRASISAGLSRLVASLLAPLVAPYCAVCRVERGDPVCPGCRRDFFDPDCLRCMMCGDRLWPGPVSILSPVPQCGRCLAARPAFDRTIVLGDYAPPLDGMVTALKSGGRLDLARVFGQLLAERVGRHCAIECLLAVPLARSRQRQRGFNQSMEIARVVARHASTPLLRRALVRTGTGPPQQSLPLHARRGNVKGAFRLRCALPIRCAAVVDDVMTSAATLDEVAAVLKQAGVGHIINLVVARTPPFPDRG
ncbi:MAG TPA: ComF family protein [Burkholderiaceae bacterium]|nr:ComF family protein [Burkholderiaceae bacterium]